MTCLKCQHPHVKRFGFYGRHRVQRYRCTRCSATFSVTPPRPLGAHTTDFHLAAKIVALLVEGVSIRAIARLTDVDKNTILSLLLTVGEKCRRICDARVRGVKPRYVQMDELWCFIHKKQKRVHTGDPFEWGDTYTWVAIDAETKLIISYLVGKRDAYDAMRFVKDFSARITGRLQLTTDGFRPYIEAVEECFGADIDFAQLVKVFSAPDTTGPGWYGPAHEIELIPTPISGDPDEAHICTSHVERQNLSVRMHLRRFTRLTNAFSKKLTHLTAAVHLYMAFYNFVRVHQTLRVTPAMESGLTDHVWSIEELLTA